MHSSLLAAIQPHVARCAELVAHVADIDVEVADANLMRIAGTGLYSKGILESLGSKGNLYRYVLEHKKGMVLTNPPHDEICVSCPGRNSCREKLSVCTPILFGGDCIGVIGLVAFTGADKERLMSKLDTYVDFCKEIAQLIATKAKDRAVTDKLEQYLGTLMQVLNLHDRCIFAFDTQKRLSYMNVSARTMLGLGPQDALPPVLAKATGATFSDMNEYELRVGDAVMLVAGQLNMLEPCYESFASVLVCETLSKITMRMGNFITAGMDEAGLDQIHGESPVMRKLKEKIRRVSQSSSTVLITGESGTGKELIARSIHSLSPRRQRPFVAINCGAIPESLLESELFGYSRGAFTGANPQGRIGKFELANQGTLFLDEIATLPLYVQVKLLRAIQEQQFTRLGANTPVQVDMRIIAASNEPLGALIKEGRFREDLYYRLNVIPVHAPPLRERGDDILMLAEIFLDKYCRRFSQPQARLARDAAEALRAYPWRGNVRELENSMEFLVNMLPEGGIIHAEHLPPELQPAQRAESDDVPPPAGGIVPLAHLEGQAIQAALAHYGASVQGKKRAAKALGIGIATLYRKLKDEGGV